MARPEAPSGVNWAMARGECACHDLLPTPFLNLKTEDDIESRTKNKINKKLERNRNGIFFILSFSLRITVVVAERSSSGHLESHFYKSIIRINSSSF